MGYGWPVGTSVRLEVSLFQPGEGQDGKQNNTLAIQDPPH